jgi:hypothetical protein
MRSHPLGKKRCADLMESHSGLQDESLQHFWFRDVMNPLDLDLADFQPTFVRAISPDRPVGADPRAGWRERPSIDSTVDRLEASLASAQAPSWSLPFP